MLDGCTTFPSQHGAAKFRMSVWLHLSNEGRPVMPRCSHVQKAVEPAFAVVVIIMEDSGTNAKSEPL